MDHWPRKKNGNGTEIRFLSASANYELGFSFTECRIKDQESQIAELRAENEMIRKQALPHQLPATHTPQITPRPVPVVRDNTVDTICDDDSATTTVNIPLASSVAKVVQPTATVSSFPVTAPSRLII